MTTGFKIWMAQIRANFLILSVFLVLLGTALYLKYPGANGNFILVKVLIIMVGVVAAHISVNLFNEYSDFHTKIDFKTKRTAFSGGSGMMVEGKNSPAAVLRVAVITLIIALTAGVYFSIKSHWIILVFALLGSASILSYTDFLTKYMLGELFAGLTLGTLVVLGTFISLRGMPGVPLKSVLPAEVVWLSIPPGILTALLLFINQFPDIDADKSGGRRPSGDRAGCSPGSVGLCRWDGGSVCHHPGTPSGRYRFFLGIPRTSAFAPGRESQYYRNPLRGKPGKGGPCPG